MFKNVFLALIILFSPSLHAEHPSSFSKSKKLLAKLYQANPVSFYCGCEYAPQEKKLVPLWQKCGFIPRKNANRAARIEWEHVVPAWAFGHQLQCWQNGGRKACRRDKQFKMMEADMHNLVPAIGEVNGDRSNYRFAMLKGEPRQYGRCDMEVDFRARKVEPPMHRRGDIARTYFYMQQRYGLSISRQQMQLFNAWAKQDPVDEWELERERKITAIQGNSNPYVVRQTLVSADPSDSETDTLSLAQRLIQHFVQKD